MPRNLPQQVRQRLVAGIDWGGGGLARTVLVIGYGDSQNRFQVLYLEGLGGRNEPDAVVKQLAERCRQWGVPWIAADGNGSGHVYNRLLLDQVPQARGFYAIYYSTLHQSPVADGRLTRWTVGRSSSIGVVFSRVKKQLIQFPQLAAVSPFLDELACEVAEYDDEQRSIRYTHPQTQPDDTLHALNYALLIAHRLQANQHLQRRSSDRREPTTVSRPVWDDNMQGLPRHAALALRLWIGCSAACSPLMMMTTYPPGV